MHQPHYSPAALHQSILNGPALTPATRALQKAMAHDAGADFLNSLNRSLDYLDSLDRLPGEWDDDANAGHDYYQNH